MALKKKRRKLTRTRVACCKCGKQFTPPDKRKQRWPCPHCGEMAWNSKLTNARLKKIAWAHLAKLKKWDHKDDQGLVACVTCGRKLQWDDPAMHAGHFIKRTRGATLFEWNNVQPQCNHCNTYQDGEQLAFAFWIRNNIGDDVPEQLLAQSREVKIWGKLELIELIESFEASMRAEGLL